MVLCFGQVICASAFVVKVLREEKKPSLEIKDFLFFKAKKFDAYAIYKKSNCADTNDYNRLVYFNPKTCTFILCHDGFLYRSSKTQPGVVAFTKTDGKALLQAQRNPELYNLLKAKEDFFSDLFKKYYNKKD